MNKKQKINEDKKYAIRFMGIGRFATRKLLENVMYDLHPLFKKDFGRVLEDFKIAIVNDYLAHYDDCYTVYTFEDMVKLNELATKSGVSLMKKIFHKYTGGNYD